MVVACLSPWVHVNWVEKLVFPSKPRIHIMELFLGQVTYI